MSSLNKATIIGRLGQDPEVRSTSGNTAVANLSIATSNKYKNKNGEVVEETQWHKCTAWGRTAEVIQQYVKKGDLIYVEGPLETKEWDDKDGNKRYTTEIKVLSMVMLGSASGGSTGGSKGVDGNPKNQQQKNPTSDIDPGFDDDDDTLPF